MLMTACAGCGYTTGSLLPDDIKTIYVDNFKNRIDVGNEITGSSRYTLYRPGVESDVSTEISDQFVFDGNLKLTRKDAADLILSGELLAYRKEPLRYDSSDDVEEYRVSVVISMVLTNTWKDEIFWEESSFTGESTYKVAGRLAKSEDMARQEAIEDLARRVVERVVEGW